MTGYQIADLVISISLSILFIAFIFLTLKKKRVAFILSGLLITSVVLFIIGLPSSFYIMFGIFLIFALFAYFVNIGDFRQLIANPYIQKTNKQRKSDKDIDRTKLNKTITETVKWLSSNKVGALITFERNTNLDNFIKTGTIINAHVTSEIIETIFYEGTRLHDGAIVIRGDIIVAASVFYTATTRPLVGKYGARHRAALGISEVSDSITIIVSEETGRISVAYSGMLETIRIDDFEKVFSTFMISHTNTLTQSVKTQK